MRSLTCNQWSDFKMRVMWVCFLDTVMIRAAAFWSLCSMESWVCGKLNKIEFPKSSLEDIKAWTNFSVEDRFKYFLMKPILSWSNDCPEKLCSLHLPSTQNFMYVWTLQFYWFFFLFLMVIFTDSYGPTLWWPNRQHVPGQNHQQGPANRNLQPGCTESRQGIITHG